MEQLKRFNGDIHTKQALRDYINDFIADEAVKKIYDREDTAYIADAHELINKAFEQLELDYGIKPEIKIENSAR